MPAVITSSYEALKKNTSSLNKLLMEIILQTPRLILREFTEADAPLIYDLNSDAQVVKYVHEPTLTSVEEARNVIVNIILPQHKHHMGRWAVHTIKHNEFIGWCGLKLLHQSGEIDLGYRLQQRAWGKGYATEAATFTLAYGFDHLNLKEIIGRAHVENTGSVKVLKKIGMHFLKDEIENGCPVKVFARLNLNQGHFLPGSITPNTTNYHDKL